jgi:hypothetical protein
MTATLHDETGQAAAASYASGWRGCLDALSHILAGRQPEPSAPSAALHDSYVEQLGLDTGPVQATEGGWQIRFERQLARPAWTVWALLATPPPAIGQPPPPGFTTLAVTPGPVTTLQLPELLEYHCPTGRVRWELSDQKGTGHGARLTLTHTGAAGGQPQDALIAWRDRLRQLAAQLREQPSGRHRAGDRPGCGADGSATDRSE